MILWKGWRLISGNEGNVSGYLKDSLMEENERFKNRGDVSMVKSSEIRNPFLLPYEFNIENMEKIIGAVNESGKAFSDYLEFLEVLERTQTEMPAWVTENRVILDLNTLKLRDFSKGGDGIYTLLVPPYSGHTSTIVDFAPEQSLVITLLENGINKVCSIDWKSATEYTKYYDIDNYLSELDICIDELGGRVNLAGMSQSGWLIAMYAARFPNKVNTLTIAGAPIDTDAGETKIKDYANKYPMEFFDGLVAAGGGIMRGDFVLAGYKSIYPNVQYLNKYVSLYENINKPPCIRMFEIFERWYEHTIDLPGKWYLQVVKEIFRENRFFKGEFVGLGKKLSLGNIKCPVYLLAGERDVLAPKEQVFNAEERLGTSKSEIVKDIANGGHIGLVMAKVPLMENWPKIIEWIKAHSASRL
ncbi:alpha/beta fold hydrolase [Candidatus Methanoperedens nitratireducens]|nr:alpha/beta fold hydrolase [Candidatus Methanoperedens nitroreducens]